MAAKRRTAFRAWVWFVVAWYAVLLVGVLVFGGSLWLFAFELVMLLVLAGNWIRLAHVGGDGVSRRERDALVRERASQLRQPFVVCGDDVALRHRAKGVHGPLSEWNAAFPECAPHRFAWDLP